LSVRTDPARRYFPDVAPLANDSLGHEKSSGEFLVVSGSAHRRDEGLVADPYLHWLLNRKLIRFGLVRTIGTPSDDSVDGDAFRGLRGNCRVFAQRFSTFTMAL
jgi:hypothetical protein